MLQSINLYYDVGKTVSPITNLTNVNFMSKWDIYWFGISLKYVMNYLAWGPHTT